jgi:hypothetical protein
MQCFTCKKEMVRTSNSQRFCSVQCRQYNNQDFKRLRSAEWQRERRATQLAKHPGRIQCLFCLKYYRKVGAHVVSMHEMTAREYREYHQLEVRRGILSEYERVPLRENVLSNGTINNLQKGKPFRFVKGGKVPSYVRSQETRDKMKLNHTKNGKWKRPDIQD